MNKSVLLQTVYHVLNVFDTLSLLTHIHMYTVIALLYFLVATRNYPSIWPSKTSDTERVVKVFIIGDFVCTILPFLLSIIYHTFMPHLKGEKVYKQLLKLDIFGVWWCCTMGPISNFYTGLYCTTGLMAAYFALYFSFSAYVLYYLMVVDCKRKRVIALTVQFFVRVCIHPLRYSLSFTSSAAVKYYFGMDIISAFGAVVNALHIPERWFPGKLDYVFNGHTLMHIAALLALIVARQGFLCDMTWLNDVGSCPGNSTYNIGMLDMNIFRDTLGIPS